MYKHDLVLRTVVLLKGIGVPLLVTPSLDRARIK